MTKLNSVLVLALLFTFTACGGGGNSTVVDDSKSKKESLAKISDFAANSGVVPSRDDYINAGIDINDLSFVDINELNSLVKSKEAKDVDSEEELTQLVHSIMDKTAPVITLKGDMVVTIPLNTNYIDAGATAIDNRDGNVAVQVTGHVNSSAVGTYKLTYKAVDRFNNTAIKKRTVNVVADSTPPKLTITSTSIKEKGDLKSIVKVSDNRDKNIDLDVSGQTDTNIPGKHHIIYTAKDSAGNETKKEVDITVIPFTITELFAKSKELNDVSYLVVGDSTRYYEGTNNILINSRNSDNGYYKDLLSPKNIKFMHTSIEGQLVEYWLNGRVEGRRGGDSFTIQDTLDKIKSVNSNHCIVEFSMGINDDLHGKISEVKENIEKSISKLKKEYPNIKILLVSPVPYYDYGGNSADLNIYYEELKDELNVAFVSGYNILNVDYPNNTVGDNLHPNSSASKKLVDEIFKRIKNNQLK